MLIILTGILVFEFLTSCGIYNPSDDKLDDLGSQSWELVSVYVNVDSDAIFVFKKELN